jgi:hypothetical protein
MVSLLAVLRTGLTQENERNLIFKAEKGFQVEAKPGEEHILPETMALLNKWAVIAAVGRYDSALINPLKYTVSDATAIYEVLTHPKFSGFPKSQVYLFTDDTETPLPRWDAALFCVGAFLPRRQCSSPARLVYAFARALALACRVPGTGCLPSRHA